MEFEYDPAKSDANKAKHGIDFEDAMALGKDEFLLVAEARTVDEARFVAVGRIGRRHWTAVFTRRSGTIRLNSVRRARRSEMATRE